MTPLEERIKEFNKESSKDPLQIKYKRIAENPFSFYRGTCHLFYEDLSKENLPSSPLCWISGDLHLENFGSYKGDNRLVYFDLNDFNEAILAPAIWEVVRMTTSILIAFNTLKIQEAASKSAIELFLKKYSSVLCEGKALYIEAQVATGIVKAFLENAINRKQKKLLKDRTVKKGNELCFNIDNEHLFALEKGLKNELRNYMEEMARRKRKAYTCLDVAFRIAGTGSIGIERYVFLLKHLTKPKKYMLIDMKEATPSSVAKYSNVTQPAWANEAERMYTIQRYMQNASPALLSAAAFGQSSFIIQEMQPSADKIDFKVIKDRPEDISCVIEDMAVLTASAQIRSSGRKGSAIADDLQAFGNDDQWQKKVIDYSLQYSKRMNDYYAEFLNVYKKGGYAG